MNVTRKPRKLLVLMLGLMASSQAHADEKEKKGQFLNRSIYLPAEFELCEHLADAIFYENDQPISAMPAQRLFQFTYYPDLQMLLPEQVDIRVEGSYKEDDEPFVAKLVMTVDGLHTANRFRSVGASEQIQRQIHKIDVRLKPKTYRLECKRFCKRVKTVASTNDP